MRSAGFVRLRDDPVSLAEVREPEGLNRAVCKTVVGLTGDRGFESFSLQRRVCLSWDFIFVVKNPGLPRGSAWT